MTLPSLLTQGMISNMVIVPRGLVLSDHYFPACPYSYHKGKFSKTKVDPGTSQNRSNKIEVHSSAIEAGKERSFPKRIAGIMIISRLIPHINNECHGSSIIFVR